MTVPSSSSAPQEGIGLQEESRLKGLFATDGFVVKRRCIPISLLDEWKQCAHIVLDALFQYLHENGHTPFPELYRINESSGTRDYAMLQGVKNGFREITMRSPGRYEVALIHINEVLKTGLPALDPLKSFLSFVPSLLDCASWDEVKLLHLSLVTSTSGSSDQSWHADGGHVNIDKHLPCHCFNIFIPLARVTWEKGPTELRPGTHYFTRNLAPMMLAARARKTLRAPETPLLDEGDVLVFDYRLLHRGRANQSDSNRTILVLTVAKPWFRDVLNFPSRRLLPDHVATCSNEEATSRGRVC